MPNLTTRTRTHVKSSALGDFDTLEERATELYRLADGDDIPAFSTFFSTIYDAYETQIRAFLGEAEALQEEANPDKYDFGHIPRTLHSEMSLLNSKLRLHQWKKGNESLDMAVRAMVVLDNYLWLFHMLPEELKKEEANTGYFHHETHQTNPPGYVYNALEHASTDSHIGDPSTKFLLQDRAEKMQSIYAIIPDSLERP